MLSIWTLLAAAVCAVSVSSVSITKRIIIHGRQLSLDLPERSKKLVYVSADETQDMTIWEQKSVSLWTNKPTKGEVRSAGEGWTFRLPYVTFDDEGTYTVYNHFGSTVSSYIVTVQPSRDIIDRVAGETLYISLAGIKQTDATLRFYSNYSTIALVENGVPVGKNYPDYVSRLKINSRTIEILKVNTSDLGRYELTDLKGRTVSNITMILVDQHDYSPNKGLIALLLLGIPGGICFCCRKRICGKCQKSKSYTQAEQSNTVPMSVPCSNTVTGPAGPAYPIGPADPGQGYNAGSPHPPPHPVQGQIHYPYPPESSGQPAVPPNPGFYPQNPVYPPTVGPGAPPAQPPQWNSPPPQYNPTVPANYMPVMSSVPPGPEPTGMNTNELPPTVPLFTPQPEPYGTGSLSTDILNSSDSGVQFDINKGKTSGNNFL